MKQGASVIPGRTAGPSPEPRTEAGSGRDAGFIASTGQGIGSGFRAHCCAVPRNDGEANET